MGSIEAMKAGSRDRYAQESTLYEGQARTRRNRGHGPVQGSIEAMIPQLTGASVAGMGYCGCRSIRELKSKSRFIRITTLGLRGKPCA